MAVTMKFLNVKTLGEQFVATAFHHGCIGLIKVTNGFLGQLQWGSFFLFLGELYQRLVGLEVDAGIDGLAVKIRFQDE